MDLSNYIKKKKQEKPLLLMAHVICGYPSFDDNIKELEIMEEMGVDLVEFQVPFSEPSADGPYFAAANQKALDNGVNVKQSFELIAEAAKRFSFPVLFMGYYNTVFKMGEETFVQRLADIGACGFIVPDLPIEEATHLYKLSQEKNIAPIRIMTPANTPERLKILGDDAQGFVYAAARKGVTGAKTSMDEGLKDFLNLCKKSTDAPLGVGFGISSKEDIDFLKENADIAIIGTAALKAWEKGGEKGLRDFFKILDL